MKLKNHLVYRMLQSWEERDKKVLSAQPLPCGVTALCDIPYADDGETGHLLDIYFPEEAEGKLPVVIDIHGGGFVYGDKELNRLFGYHIAKRGYTVFNLNYRLASDAVKVPGQVQDIMRALRFIQEHIKDYPADETQVFLMGESAGGVLAVMAALLLKSPRLRKLFNTPETGLNIKALAIFCGMMRFDAKSIGYRGMRSMCFEKGYQKQDIYRNMIFDQLPEMALLPPVFLSTSQEDELKSMTLDFLRTLQKNKIPCQLKCFPKGQQKRLGHIFAILHPGYEESIELIEEMLAFFTKHGANKDNSGGVGDRNKSPGF